MGHKILISAGEASGDRYAGGVAAALRGLRPDLEFFGCTGAEMRRQGVETLVDSASLSVVGLVEVVHHIPRIYGEYRKLIAAAEREKPVLAILTDSPDFHLRLAKQLRNRGIPVIYLVAPQAWAWRKGRVRQIRRNVRELHCIFPFEEQFFRSHGVNAHYIGHPLARVVRPRLSRAEFYAKHELPERGDVIALCPGSRGGEMARHLPYLRSAVDRIGAVREATFVLAAPPGAKSRFGERFFEPLCGGGRVRYTEDETWDAMAYANLTLAASGTVTIEAALLGAPMVTFYRVTPVSWLLGKALVSVPSYTMVNLVAGRPVVPELMQGEMSGERLAGEALRLLEDPEAMETMRRELREVRATLETARDPFETSAGRIDAVLREKVQ